MMLRILIRFSGGYCGGVTPDPIPNSEVKPSCADGTAGETLWESRSLPDLWAGSPLRDFRPFFYGRILPGLALFHWFSTGSPAGRIRLGMGANQRVGRL